MKLESFVGSCKVLVTVMRDLGIHRCTDSRSGSVQSSHRWIFPPISPPENRFEGLTSTGPSSLQLPIPFRAFGNTTHTLSYSSTIHHENDEAPSPLVSVRLVSRCN